MILKQKKNNKNRWYRGRNRSKNVKNANLLFWGAFFGGKKQLFFQKLQSSNFMNNMNRCMWLKIIGCARSYVYRAKPVKKRQKRKNVNFGDKLISTKVSIAPVSPLGAMTLWAHWCPHSCMTPTPTERHAQSHQTRPV